MDEFVAASGYHRKYAIELLTDFAGNETKSPGRAESKGDSQPRRYTAEAQAALVVIWDAANQICSKRLIPFLPELVEVLERHGHLKVPTEVKERLLTISAATVGRLLADIRHERQGDSRDGSQRSSLLKQLVPIRTFAEWGEVQPGYLEVNLVAHCGDHVSGSYLQTLILTDVATGWTECLALLYRDQTTVLQAIRQTETWLPFALLGLDTDKGSRLHLVPTVQKERSMFR